MRKTEPTTIVKLKVWFRGLGELTDEVGTFLAKLALLILAVVGLWHLILSHL